MEMWSFLLQKEDKMENIKDMAVYNSRMSAGMEDKLFFLPFLKKSPLLIDYGCADGTLARYIKDIYPDAVIYGYDIDESMLELAKQKLGNNNVYLSHSRVFEILKLIKDNALNIFPYTQEYQTHDEILNLSSVIHEVYSYGSKEDIEEFWKNVFGIGFDKIAIRDMCFATDREYPFQFESFQEFEEKFMRGIVANNLEKLWKDYRKIYSGNISYQIITHFLMKYHYIENWDRESKENYFPLSVDELKRVIPDCYDIVYENSYLLPYIKEYVKNEFDIELDCFTHIKIILKKRE